MKKIVSLLVVLVMVASLAGALASAPSKQHLSELVVIEGQGDIYFEIVPPFEGEETGDDGLVEEILGPSKQANPLDTLPEEIRARLPEGFTVVNEILQLKLKGNVNNITADMKVAIKFDTPYTPDSTVYLAVAIPGDEGREWVLLEGKVNAEKNVEVTFDMDTLQKIGEKTITVMAISES